LDAPPVASDDERFIAAGRSAHYDGDPELRRLPSQNPTALAEPSRCAQDQSATPRSRVESLADST